MRVSKEKAAQNRERILTSAARLFREHGIGATGVDSITEDAGLTQDLIRQIFTGVSPMAHMERFAANPRQVLVVHATYDLTFLSEFSLDVLANFDRHKVDYVSKVLPCGHYTTGETPYKYIDGWYLGSFIYKAFKHLATQTTPPG